MLARNSKSQIFLSTVLFLLGGIALNNVIANTNLANVNNSDDFVFGQIAETPAANDTTTAYGPKPR